MMSKICMNESCRLTTSSEWKIGWGLKSGGFATLCYSCGAAYEKFVFCETFHKNEDGWRDCRMCRKRMHCGCVASKMLLEYLDTGGVACVSCVKSRDATHLQPVQIVGDEIAANGTLSIDVVPTVGNQTNRTSFSGLLQIGSNFDANGPRKLLKTQRFGNASSYLGKTRSEGSMLPFGEVNISSQHFTQQPVGSSMFLTPDSHRPEQGVKDMHESLAQSPLNISLSNTLSASSSGVSFSDVHVEGSDQNKGSPSQRGRSVLPKPPKPVSSAVSDATRSSSQPRIARPPAEGRGRSQLLPRYWPRITEQELQQISGDLKSTIVPLFEKVLSASDAGRIGRLVLPKACAEAYFPPINQSEGLPIRIQDVKGKEWTFQFRFWPNNNSRMYVLEGVTPCIQNMQLQAGDTVTFSRIDPGGQLVMGFRKSTSNVDNQDPPSSVFPNGGSSGENSHSGASDNMLNGSHTAEDPLQRQTLITDRKKARNLGKNKRLLMHSDDAFELRVTWEEAQELLRPPPTNNPTIIKIDDYEFEEYDEPPVFGKKTIFTVGPSGQQEQWVQCDNCSKWRKLPVDFLVPASWTCPDNIYDSNSSCSAPDEINPREEDALNKASKDYKRKMIGSSVECEPSGLDALANAAVLGDNTGDLAESSVEATTTRHPRHRPGCSCIVCIQPPSGKGKHAPQCKCTVCATVKRRFKTLMQRKKKRQSEREAELAQGPIQDNSMDASTMEGATEIAVVEMKQLDTDVNLVGNPVDVGENGKGHLDLNSHPGREEDMLAEAAAGINMDSLIDAASIPLDIYLRQNGVSSLSQALTSHLTGGSEGVLADEGCSVSANGELDKKFDDEQ